MHKLLIAFILLFCLSLTGEAQSKRKQAASGTVNKPMQTFKKEAWMPTDYKYDHPIYFPDYYTFYDPQRGYVVWEKDSWIARPSMPLFLKSSDLKKPRIQILEDIGINKRPELDYPRYMKMYPALPGERDVIAPVPKPAGQPGIH